MKCYIIFINLIDYFTDIYIMLENFCNFSEETVKEGYFHKINYHCSMLWRSIRSPLRLVFGLRKSTAFV